MTLAPTPFGFTFHAQSRRSTPLREPPITVGGVCFLPITVNGQSFLLNQIRHMIALAVLIYRAGASLGCLDRVFSSKVPPYTPEPARHSVTAQ